MELLQQIDAPADLDWLNKRLAVLLGLPQYKRNSEGLTFDNQILSMMDVLKDYPDHIIDLACKWWISGDNEDSRWLPESGAIERKCKEYMQPITSAKAIISNYDRTLNHYGLAELAEQIWDGEFPTLEEFDNLMDAKQIKIDSKPIVQRVMAYHEHIKVLCFYMRQAIMINQGIDPANDPKKPMTNQEIDDLVNTIGLNHDDAHTNKKRGFNKVNPSKGVLNAIKKT